MLQFIRNTAGSWVVKVLFVLLILSFGVWGVNDAFRSHDQSSAAIVVGDAEVSYAELDQEFRRQIDRLRPMLGGSLTPEQAIQYGLLEGTINGLVQRALFDRAAADAGVEVGETVIKRAIAAEPAFRGQGGAFDPNVFQTVLRNSGLTEGTYVSGLRHDIAGRVTAGVVTSAATAPKTLVDALYRFRGEQRVAEVVAIPHASVGDVGTPGEDAIRTYYDEHALTFTAPEYRAITIARIAVDDIAKGLTVPEPELRAVFAERADEFRVAEKRSIRMAVLDDEAKANALYEAARSADLDTAARQAGVDVVPFDGIARGELPGMDGAVFDLAAGEISAPIKTDFGWHVVQVMAVEPEKTKSFEDVKDELLAALRRERATDRLYEVLNRIEDGLAAGTALEEIASANGMSLTAYKAIDATGKDTGGKDAGGAADLPVVLKTAFTQAPGQPGGLTESAEGTFFVARVDSITAPELRPLDTVRDQVVAAWRDEEREQRAIAKARAIADDIKAKGGAADLKAIAEAAGGVFATTQPFTRDARSVEWLPAVLVGQMFAAKPGDVVTGADADSQVVARLASVVAADPATAGAKLDPVRQTVRQGMAADLAAGFAIALQRSSPVTIRRDRIEEMYRSSSNP